MKKVTINLYTFEELKEESKKRAIAEQVGTNFGDNWHEDIEIDFKEKAKELGYEIGNIYFDLYIRSIDLEGSINPINWLKIHKVTTKYKALVEILKNSPYDKTERIDKTGLSQGNLYLLKIGSIEESEYVEVYKLITNELEELKKRLLKDLISESDYLNSDEYISEYLANEHNKYLFLENGKMYVN